MKVKCIHNIDKLGNTAMITIGKTYDVICDHTEYYKIICDYNIDTWYHKYLFKELSEVRNAQINKILGE